jgi:RNA polymerase sigma factor (sigma-70 family)
MQLAQSLLDLSPNSETQKENRRWQPDEIAMLYGSTPIETLAHTLNRSYTSVRRKLEKLKISKSKREKKPGQGKMQSPFPVGPSPTVTISPWTVTDISNLHYYWNLQGLGICEIASFINRDPQDVQNKGNSLNLPKKPWEVPHFFQNSTWRTDLDASNLPDLEQHQLAEASASRIAHLHKLERNKAQEQELNTLVKIQEAIYTRCIHAHIKRLLQGSATPQSIKDELKHIGLITIYEVATRWDPTKGKNYSRDCIGKNIGREMREWLENQRTIRLPEKVNQDARKLQKAEMLGTKDACLEALRQKHSERYISHLSRHRDTWHPFHCQTLLSDDYEEETSSALHAEIGDPSTNTKTYTEFDPDMEAQDIRNYLHTVLKHLPTPERLAISGYYGIGENGESLETKTLEVLGQEHNVTRERIRQRINKGQKRLRKILFQMGIENPTALLAA